MPSKQQPGAFKPLYRPRLRSPLQKGAYGRRQPCLKPLLDRRLMALPEDAQEDDPQTDQCEYERKQQTVFEDHLSEMAEIARGAQSAKNSEDPA